MPIHALNHVGFSSPDLPRLVAFYRDGVGCGEVSAFSWPVGTTAADAGLGLVDSSADVAILNAGNLYLELFQFHTPEPAPQDPDRPVHDEGISRLCLEVIDADAALARLLDAGARPVRGVVDVAGSHRAAAVRDPDGNLVELRQTLRADAPSWNGRLSVTATPPVGPDDERRLVELAPGFLGVNHVGLTTGDLDRHVAFYAAAGGLAPVVRDGWSADVAPDGDGSRGEHTLLDAGNVYLDLTSYAAPRGRALDPARPINDHGLNHLCFDISAMDELHADLVAGGMTYTLEPVTMPAGHTVMGYGRDPFGIPLELVENKSSQAFLWCGHLQLHPHPHPDPPA